MSVLANMKNHVKSMRCGLFEGRPGWVRVGSILFFLVVWLFIAQTGWAQSAHPFAVPESRVPVAESGWLAEFYGQMSMWQSHVYKQLNAAVRALANQPGAAWWLIALSFGYGVFHALGPGHGKAVLSAYVVANRETMRNGAMLSMVSAMLQALVAVLLVAVAAWALNLTGQALNEVTRWLEMGSGLMLAGLGSWLVWRHVLSPIGRASRKRLSGRRTTTTSRHAHAHSHQSQNISHHQGHHHDGHEGHHHDHHHDHHHHDHCCGHEHAPPPDAVSGRLDWTRAWSVVLSMGLRPCTGAVLVLVFSLSQGMFYAGVISAFAMGLGTGITVAMLAVGSLLVSRMAEGVAGGAGSAWGKWVMSLLQALAAVAVLLLGLVLLGTSLVSG